jgi:hypothetical protein
MSSQRKRKPKDLFLVEPRNEYDCAIVEKTKEGRPLYCYRRLVDATMRLQDWEREKAKEWVDFNIVTLPGIRIKYGR